MPEHIKEIKRKKERFTVSIRKMFAGRGGVNKKRYDKKGLMFHRFFVVNFLNLPMRRKI